MAPKTSWIALERPVAVQRVTTATVGTVSGTNHPSHVMYALIAAFCVGHAANSGRPKHARSASNIPRYDERTIWPVNRGLCLTAQNQHACHNTSAAMMPQPTTTTSHT
ncbi:uncharacterized protein FRV6_11824 [Fusarium oxysporum]|uniref:Uncharacterized protein n=1 Tax=Fusarium oxysporum TaxID=5507 RepID=A0A2H3TGG5_FUSOX|nr:uncharacterized protein FRV6_11824 [Fusarium oxysporum]